MTQRPQRRAEDHVHGEYWQTADQHRYEDKMALRIKELEGAVERLTSRITLMTGAIGLLIFILPILAPYVRELLGLGQ